MPGTGMSVSPADAVLACPLTFNLGENLPVEENIECWFGEPILSGDRAAIEWWGSWREQGQKLTFAGVTVLRFDDQGNVADHRDYDNHVERREAPYPGW